MNGMSFSKEFSSKLTVNRSLFAQSATPEIRFLRHSKYLKFLYVFVKDLYFSFQREV